LRVSTLKLLFTIKSVVVKLPVIFTLELMYISVSISFIIASSVSALVSLMIFVMELLSVKSSAGYVFIAGKSNLYLFVVKVIELVVVNGSMKEGSSTLLYNSIISPYALCDELVLLHKTIA